MNKNYITWDEYFKLCDNIANITKDAKFDAIIGISRGGLMPSAYIANKLDIRKVYSIGVHSYEGETQQELIVYQNIPNVIKGKVLVIDEVADSGKTLDFVKNTLCLSEEPITIATLHYKKRSKIVPDIYSKEVNNEDWIVYPYEM